ncbi:hypothetical protein EYF80_024540 [Liparis tanakae]|uniref:Uncharacterized protein n=1 Tax=Liparis tanakae TaxID=230148 RepID=A0A4Z2HI33_9TELE|nr:hypothetical protein EYF80_024540 [Liparis tanakae]
MPSSFSKTLKASWSNPQTILGSRYDGKHSHKGFQGGILGPVHGGEVEHGHVGLAGMVLGELQVRQSAAGGEGGGIVGVAVQRLVIHVRRSQQLLCVAVVLWRRSDRCNLISLGF